MEDKIANLRSFTYVTRCEAYPRIGHRAIQVGHHILVFGGTNSQNEFVTPILRISCQSMTVDPIVTKTELKLEGFSLFSYKSQKQDIYVWGGKNEKGVNLTNRLLRFTGDDFEVVFQNGNIPSPRFNHTSYFFSKKYLIMQGGMGNQQFFNDFYLLDCSVMTWNKLIINISLNYSLNSRIFWNGGRGFFMVGETFDPQNKKINYQNHIYQLRFSDFKQFKMNIQLLNVTKQSKKLNDNKIDSTVILVNFQSPYLMVIGGQKISNEIQQNFNSKNFTNRNDIWIFNLQTLEWTQGNLKISASFGFQAIFFQERLYLIGGVSSSSKDLFNYIQVTDINGDSLQAKVCHSCREIYGLREYTGYNKNFSIKYEFEEKPKTFFTNNLVSKFAKFIKNPISAIGLLIDNSMNLNGTLIRVQFSNFEPQSKQNVPGTQTKMPLLVDNPKTQGVKTNYNYIKITDDTSGFTQNEITQSMYSFGMKSQKLTSDCKYEQQLQIRKEYGVNIKIGSLRLGKSCLFATKTLDDCTFISYFSTTQYDQKFAIYSYSITEKDRIVSSEINRNIIKQNIINFIPFDYETFETNVKTKIYIFHLSHQLSKDLIDFDGYDYTYQNSSSVLLSSLKLYLESLYFTPYIGRTLYLQNQSIKYKNYPEIFKKDQNDAVITKLDLALKDEYFKQYAFYQYHSQKYSIKEILIYHQNRFIFSVGSKISNLCGYLVVPSTINIDLCKSKIENSIEQKLLNNFLQNLFVNYEKYVPNYTNSKTTKIVKI